MFAWGINASIPLIRLFLAYRQNDNQAQDVNNVHFTAG
jgi:hypothetical protein